MADHPGVMPATAGGKTKYPQTRLIIGAVGVAVVAVLALVMYLRHVETVELVAVLLFAPIFAALLVWDIAGGAAAGVLAAGIYVAMRWSAISAVGFGKFSGLVISRVIGFLVFGIAGGVANRRLRRSLVKLDLYDQIDDATGLFNPKFLVLQVDLEAARSRRYQSFFALAVVDIPHAWLDPLGRRRAARVLKDLGGLIAESIRTVDRGIHGPMPQVHRLVVLMPETGPEGAVVFTTRLVDRLEQWLGDEGVKPPAGGHLASQALSFPDDEAEITRLREEFDELDRAQYPAAARA